jgi:hypothetical protein
MFESVRQSFWNNPWVLAVAFVAIAFSALATAAIVIAAIFGVMAIKTVGGEDFGRIFVVIVLVYISLPVLSAVIGVGGKRLIIEACRPGAPAGFGPAWRRTFQRPGKAVAAICAGGFVLGCASLGYLLAILLIYRNSHSVGLIGAFSLVFGPFQLLMTIAVLGLVTRGVAALSHGPARWLKLFGTLAVLAIGQFLVTNVTRQMGLAPSLGPAVFSNLGVGLLWAAPFEVFQALFTGWFIFSERQTARTEGPSDYAAAPAAGMGAMAERS